MTELARVDELRRRPGSGRVSIVPPDIVARRRPASRPAQGECLPDHLAGRLAARLAYLGTMSDRVEIAADSTGRPVYYLGPHADRRYHLSIAHTRGWGVAACTTVPVGVDVEWHRQVSLDVVARAAAPRELSLVEGLGTRGSDAFLAIWTLKEAAVKMTGGDLAVWEPLIVAVERGAFLIQLPDRRASRGCCHVAEPGRLTIGLVWPAEREVDWEWPHDLGTRPIASTLA